jgi:nucleoside-diphosphate-sugar epimerase
MKILVTGAAGFIGFTTARRLLERGDEVVGLDNLNEYYDVRLKLARLEILKQMPGFRFVKLDLADRPGMTALFEQERFGRVIHLAAQAGVRYSIENPLAYVDSNVVGFANVLEGCRHHGVEHLVYASTSSVYGANTKMPFSVHQNVDHPLSFYAATKKANELMAHVCAPVLAAGDRPAILHGIRAVGTAGHGAVPVHAQHPRGRADQRLQLRPPPSRLHLRRRHRRGRGSLLRPRGHCEPWLGQRRTRPGHEPRPVSPL